MLEFNADDLDLQSFNTFVPNAPFLYLPKTSEAICRKVLHLKF